MSGKKMAAPWLVLGALLIFDFQNCSQPTAIQVTAASKGLLSTIQPALAVRGMACITCHTQSSSNVITDYGYGNDWYFDTTADDSFYADRTALDSGIDTLALQSGKVIAVPKAAAPASIQAMFNVTSLADFIRARFAQDSSNTPAQVLEVDQLTIAVPFRSRIMSVFNATNETSIFNPDNAQSPPLSGLVYDAANDVFKISNMVCDGDLYLARPAVFDSATIKSVVGCRIYSVSSIFIQGAVTSVAYGSSTTFNTQIASTESIWAGAGRINNGAFCETASGAPAGWYSASTNTNNIDCTIAANAANPYCDTLYVRATYTVARSTFSRNYPNAASLGAFMNFTDVRTGGTLASEASAVEASLGHPLYDASCGAGGRAVSMSRLMLVAPYVNDRYNGDFSGSVIAEAALMSLGSFVFQFDPVFAQVNVLPKLNANELLSGVNLTDASSGSAGSASPSN